MKTKERNGYEPRLFELPLSSVFHCSMYCSSCLLHKSRRKTYDKSFVEKEVSDVYRCFFDHESDQIWDSDREQCQNMVDRMKKN